MNNDIVIEVNDVSKKFYIGTCERLTLFSTLRYKLSGEYPTSEFWALRNINFSVKKGEMIAVIGSNGAGKTTLLRILSGIMFPTSGSYRTVGEVSCIFELGLGFNPRFSALENVYLYGALHGYSRKEMDKKLPQIIEFSEQEKFMGAKLGDLSSGMRVRIAFATVIHLIQGIIMIDEALSVGDAAFQNKCVKAIENLLTTGNTVLFIAHGMMSDVRKLCTNALYLDKGCQMGFGRLDEMDALYTENILKGNNNSHKP